MPDNSFLIGVNTQGVITYDGVASTDYGIVVSEAPVFERPARKQTVIQVPGRNGSVVIQENAWEDVVRSYNVWLSENVTEDSGGDKSGYLVEYVDAYEEFLNSRNGYLRLSDNFEPDVYRLAYYSGGDSFSNLKTQIGRATLRFTCRPERFLVIGETPVNVNNGDTINNPTRFESKPLIHIEASSKTIGVTINGKTITANVTDYINIDCEKMNAYRLASENKNADISGDFPTIASGSNTITITGTYTKVTIKPNWFVI
jgi:phage-related protein